MLLLLLLSMPLSLPLPFRDAIVTSVVGHNRVGRAEGTTWPQRLLWAVTRTGAKSLPTCSSTW